MFVRTVQSPLNVERYQSATGFPAAETAGIGHSNISRGRPRFASSWSCCSPLSAHFPDSCCSLLVILRRSLLFISMSLFPAFQPSLPALPALRRLPSVRSIHSFAQGAGQHGIVRINCASTSETISSCSTERRFCFSVSGRPCWLERTCRLAWASSSTRNSEDDRRGANLSERNRVQRALPWT